MRNVLQDCKITSETVPYRHAAFPSFPRRPREGVMELADLLESARLASPGQRIESRSAIAAFGAEGIEGVRPWLGDDVLAAFAVRVIEQAGVNGQPELATKVLRAARTTVPEGVVDDVTWALARIHDVAHPKVVATPAPAAPVRRPIVRPTAASRRRTR